MVSVGLRMTATVPVAWESRLVFGEPRRRAEGARRDAMRHAAGARVGADTDRRVREIGPGKFVPVNRIGMLRSRRRQHVRHLRLLVRA